MIEYFSKKNKGLAFICIFLFLFVPLTPILGAELNSDNFTITESDFDSGGNMNSTNFSVSGSLTQGQKGFFSSSALPLVPGVITSCGKITAPGTYTLGSNLIGISESCFSVQADNVTIDGDGYTVIAANSNSSYAVTATSSVSAGSAYGTTTIQDITFSGFAGGVRASGNNATSGNTNGGNGGLLVIVDSTLGSIITSAGLGSGTGSVGNGGRVVVTNSTTGNITNTGTSGSISIHSDSNLNISNNIYTTSGSGILNITYSGTLITTNTTLSALQQFIMQGVNYGSYVGGAFPLFPSTITSCGSLYFAGTYTLGANITGNCSILGTGITIAGGGNTLTGNVSANNHGVTLSNINVTGTVSTTGAGAGALVVNNSSNLTGTISVTGAISGDGSSSLGNTTISAGGSVSANAVSFVSNVTNNGTINSGNAVAGKITNNSIINTSGTFTFNASSTNSGTVNGNAILSASSTNSGTITGDATFNAYTASNGEVSFSGTTAFGGTGYVNGTVYDSTGTDEITTWIFNASSTNTGILKGDAIFNDTSINTLTGTVQGDAIFTDSSSNLGIVTGNSDVYSPVTRPLAGTTNGSVIYHEYAGLYFNDSAVGHGVTGQWDDINNWWLDANATVHSPIIPTEGDDVIILSGTISTTTSTAHVKSITFQNSTSNEINITVESDEKDAALFNSSSVNNGTITGNATFAGADSVHNGTVTGFITRQYSTGMFTVVTDFTHNGIHWIVQAINGATVDLTGATYSLADNIFEALNNAVFIWNTVIGTGSPDLEVFSPTTGTNNKWQPNVSWDTNVLCQYKIDAGTYASVNCSNDGSDIPRPTAGSHTIFFKSTDANGGATEKSVLFTYDNTQPIDTDCSYPLDEVTRPYYYLTSNVGNCSVTASTTLRGDNNGGGQFYTMGNITGSSTNISLQNVTATGTVSGFTNITVASSTISATTTVAGSLYVDTLSSFGGGVVNSGATVYGGRFTGDLVNNGTLVNSTTTPVTVAGSTTNNGTINNGFIFNAASTNAGTVNGTTTLNDASVTTGTVNGDLIFNTLTAVSNILTFSDNTTFLGTGSVTGNIFDNQGELISIWNFEDSSTNLAFTKGTTYFHDTATNIGTVSGDAHFNDSSTNSGTVTGNAYRYRAWLIENELGGTVNGSITYYSYPNAVSFQNISGDNNWNNTSNWFRFVATTTPLGRTPIIGEDLVLFASTTLKSNTTNDIYMAVDEITLTGASYTLTGNIFGNGAYEGHDAYDFNLRNIIVTGTTTAMGGDGNPDVDGGKGGNIDVQNSSTNVISVNGGDPLHNGGDAGTIYVFNTIAIEEGTPILAVGGASVGCGFGGSGGNVTLVDTSGYVLIVDPGASATSTIAEGGGCDNPPAGDPPTRGQTSVTGEYTPPSSTPTPETPNNDATSPSPSVATKIKETIDRFLPVIDFNLQLSPFNLTPLPTFGSGEDSFSFIERIKNFFTASIPQDIVEKYQVTPTLLSSLGIFDMNDLIALKNKKQVIEDTKIPGLFTVYSTTLTKPLTSYINFDFKKYLYQSVRVLPKTKLIISLVPTIRNSTYKATFDGKEVTFIDNVLIIEAPSRPGIYTLDTSASVMSLKIQVLGEGEDFEPVNNVFVDFVIAVVEFFKDLWRLFWAMF